MNVSIRPWQLADAEEQAALINNKQIQDNLRDGIPFPYTKQDAEEFIGKTLNAEPDMSYIFAIIADGKLAGCIGLDRKANIHSRTAEMGYYIGQDFWGKGIATDAVKQASEYVFDHTDIIRIFAEPFSENAASCRVLEKAGFEFEGTLVSNAIKNGKALDMKMYALIK